MRYYVVVLIILLSVVNSYSSEMRIRNIYINRQRVFEPSDKDWFFLADFMNKFHVTTHEYVIKDELLFNEDESTDTDYLYETERNLRSTELFTSVQLEVDSIEFDTYDVYITTKDRWSLYPALLFGSGGGSERWGAKLEEKNFLGTGTEITLEALNRTENSIGWQGSGEIEQRRLFRTELALDAIIEANKYRTNQLLNLVKPFRTLDTKNSYGIGLVNNFGNDFLFLNDTTELVPVRERVGNIFYAHSWRKKDRVIFSGLIQASDIERGNDLLRQAFDNMGEILLQFSSVSQDFYAIRKVNQYHTEDMVVGGYGSATLGKIFPMGNKGVDGFFYLGGQGERSYYDGTLYLWGQITGASGFRQAQAVYTFQSFEGLGFYRITPDILFAAHFKQETVWNWFALKQLILDSDGGLRGYASNSFFGDNRLISNFEIRAFPDWNVWVFDLSGVAFYDIGTVWNQQEKLNETRFHSSAGLGLRLHFTKSSSSSQTFRIDLPYNFDTHSFGGIVLSTKQLFSAFGTHDFKAPRVYGNEYDYE